MSSPTKSEGKSRSSEGVVSVRTSAARARSPAKSESAAEEAPAGTGKRPGRVSEDAPAGAGKWPGRVSEEASAGEGKRPGRVMFGSIVVEADARELLEHLDTPSLMRPLLDVPVEKDRALYLQCVDELRESLGFLERVPQLECCVKELSDGSRLMEQALDKLQADAVALLSGSCLRLQKDPHLKQLAAVARKEAQAAASAAAASQEGEGGSGPDSEGSGSGRHRLRLPELLPPGACGSLAAVAHRVVAGGRAKELCEAYTEERRAWQEAGLKEMGLVALLAEDVGSARWEKLEDMIGVWNEQLRMLTSLAAMEDALADQALRPVDPGERKALVASLACQWLKPLLEVGAAAAGCKKSPEKMVPLLDMTEGLLDARAMFQRLALVGPGSPLAMVDSLLGAVREAIKGTAGVFRRLIQEDDVGAEGGNKGGAQQRQEEEGSVNDRDRDRDRDREKERDRDRDRDRDRERDRDRDKDRERERDRDRDRERDVEGERGAPASLSTKGEGKGHRRIRELFHGLKHTKGGPKADEGADSVSGRGGGAPTAGPAVPGADGDVQKITKYVSNFIIFLMHRDLPYVALLEATLGSREALREWLRQIMAALENNLELKAQALADERLQHLFLMNNKSYVFLKFDSGESAAKEMLGDKWIHEIERQYEQHRNFYIHLVVNPFEIILAADRDRDVSLFTKRILAFNTSFEELCQKQRQWRVPDQGLCAFIKLEQRKGVVSLYKEFLQSHKHFTDGTRSTKVRHMSVSEIEQKLAESFPERRRS